MESSSFSPVSFTKSATATVGRPPGTCRSQIRQVARPATVRPTRAPRPARTAIRRARRGRSTLRRAERSSESQAFPSLGRAAGSSESAAPTTFATARGTPPRAEGVPGLAGAGGGFHMSSVRASASPVAGVLPTGLFPVSISPRTIPAAHTSARSSTAAPAACSGAMYAGVPAPLDPSVPSRCASPKSSSFTRPSSQTKTLAGFESLCSTPREWACASPPAICSAIRSASSTGNGPFSIRLASVSPRSSSMTRYAPAAQVPTSWIVTMAGWSSFATASASFSIHSSFTRCFDRPGFRALSATVRPSCGSKASYTAPKPPRPISRRIWYRPTTSPAVSGSRQDEASSSSGVRATSARRREIVPCAARCASSCAGSATAGPPGKADATRAPSNFTTRHENGHPGGRRGGLIAPRGAALRNSLAVRRGGRGDRRHGHGAGGVLRRGGDLGDEGAEDDGEEG